MLGTLGLIQMTILPGLILLKWRRLPQGNYLPSFFYCFAGSLLFNNLLVILLTLFKIYKPLTLYIIFACEVILAVYLYRKELGAPLASRLQGFFANLASRLRQLESGLSYLSQKPPLSILGFLVLVGVAGFFAIDSILWLIKVTQINATDIFHKFDAVVSWNPWAQYWVNNRVPPANFYPQLIPTNWSISYVFMQNDQIQFFANGIMPLFTLFSLILMAYLALRKSNPGYLLALVFTRFMTKKFQIFDDGYVDTASTFLSFLAIAALLFAADAASQKEKNWHLLWGGIAAAAAASTKQGGLLVLVLYPVLAAFLLLGSETAESRKSLTRLIWRITALAWVMALPMYAINQILIFSSQNVSNITYLVSDIHEGRSLFERLGVAVQLLGKYNLLYVVGLISFPFIKRSENRVFMAVGILHSLIWAFFFSYSTINLSIAIPLIGCGAGLGLMDLYWRLAGGVDRPPINRIPTAVVPVLVALALMGLSTLTTDSRLITLQDEQQRRLFIPQINELVYELLDQGPPNALVISDYRLDLLPELEEKLVIDHMNDFNQFIQDLDENENIRFILLPEYADPQIRGWVEDQYQQGFLDKRFQFGLYHMYEIVN